MLLRSAHYLQQRQYAVLRATFNCCRRRICSLHEHSRHHGVPGTTTTTQQSTQTASRTITQHKLKFIALRHYSKDEQKLVMLAEAANAKVAATKDATAKKLSAAATATATQESTSPQTATSPSASATPSPGIIQTKNFEVKTTKGVLSITTTIEDSKINDIVFEKAAEVTPPVVPTNVTTAPKVIVTAVPAASAPVISPAAPVATNIVEPNLSSKVEAVKLKIIPKFLKPKEAVAATTTPDKITAEVLKAVPTPKIATSTSTTDAAAAAAATIAAAAATKPKRARFDCNRSSLERNFITPARAMSDFMLKASDLESLPKIKRRSPYEQEPPITVYWRRDVEAKAISIWGSRENMLKEILKRECERKQHQQNIFTVKRRLRDYRREVGAHTFKYADQKSGLGGKSGKVVLTAIAINGTNFLVKLGGWIYSGSHSMFAECIHSLADMVNQIILAYGIHKSVQTADSEHPYGYTNMKYVSALISGVGIFCVGCGLSVYHGITGIFNPQPMQDLFWAYFILGGTVLSEGATLIVAINELRCSAKEKGMSFKEYVVSGQDPCVNVVLTEDSAAVAGVILAASCMGLSTYTGSPLYDAIGSIIVGGILGGVASFIIYTNVRALVGKTIATERLEKMNSVLESDVMIRAIHDVKGIDMGNSLVRYKAELDFDGRELTRSYLDKQDLTTLLQTVKSFRSVDELESFLLDQGENIVDLMGGEIDRIEMNLRNQFPEVRHCDLEVL